MKFFVIILIISALSLAEEPIVKGKVITLTDENHDAMIKNGIWLVKYFAPVCF